MACIHERTSNSIAATRLTEPKQCQGFLHHQHQSLDFNDELHEASHVLSLKRHPPHKEDLSLQHPKQRHKKIT